MPKGPVVRAGTLARAMHLQRLKWLAAARLPDQISSVGMSQLVCFVEGKQENGIAVQKRMEPTRGVPTVCGN